MLAFNANLRYNHDEPQFAYYDPKENKPQREKAQPGRADISEPPKKASKRLEHKTYDQLLREKEEQKKEEELRKIEMEEAEKLRPVTLIRSQQGHRFIRKVPNGDESMAHELDQ